MIYKFDKVDIASYCVLPMRGDGGVAISGMFDFPKRKGEIERNWGNQVEPYLNPEDLEYDGRTIGLKLVMEDAENLGRFRAACLACRELGTELGNFDVVLASEVNVERVGDKLLKMELKFNENRVAFEDLTLAGSARSGGTGVRVDDFNLARDFGITVAEVKGDLKIPKRIDVNTTAPYMNTRYRENPSVSLECVMRDRDLKAIGARMRQFHALWRQPGTRELHLADGHTRNVFVKNGFSVSVVNDGIVKFTLNLTGYDRNISEE